MKEKTKVINTMKELSKEKAALCKAIKPKVKDAMRHREVGGEGAWREQYEMAKLKSDFRAFHIARCELRGRTREQIEKPSDDNKPNEAAIEFYKLNWGKNLEEAIRADAEGLESGANGDSVGSCIG